MDYNIKSKKTTCDKKENHESNFKIIKKFLNIDDNTLSYEFEIDVGEGITTRQIFLRNEVYNLSDKLLNSGVDVSDKKIFLNNFSFEEKKVPISYQHSSLGFSKYNNQLIYKANTAVNIDSTYVGSFDVSSHGSFEGWKNAVTKYAMPTVALQFMLIAGLSAVVMGFLRDAVDGSLLIHVYSDSSKGKTTGCLLAISTAGNPSAATGKQSLQIDWGDTFNYRIASLSNNFGVPIIIDEASKIAEKEISSFIYSCCNGSSKGRLSSNGTPRDVKHWSTCCISNGEQSLLPLCNENQGIRARIIEVNFDTITESADQADKLKQGIFKNYGFANKILAKYIIENEDKVKQEFYKWTSVFREDLKDSSPLIARISKRLSALMTTTVISKEALGLNFDVSEIKNILIKAVNDQNEDESLNIGDRLVEYLTEDYFVNSQRYCNKKTCELNYSLPANCFGVYRNIQRRMIAGEVNVDYEVCYFKSKFEELLSMGGFNNKKLCLQELKKKGYLIHDRDRMTSKRKINGQTMTVYVVDFPREILSTSYFRVS